MSYSILHGGNPFMQQHSPELALISPRLVLEANKSGMLTFSITPQHRDYSNIEVFSSIFEVYDMGTLFYRGRCISAKRDMQDLKTVTVEGMLGWLQDSLCGPFDFAGSLESFLSAILAWHNAQVQSFQQISLGTVTVIDSYVHYSSTEYMNAYEIIRTRLLNTHGGYLNVRFDSSGNAYLDYLADFPNAVTHEVRPFQNLIDLLTVDDSDDLYTAIIPLGAEILDTNGVSTGDRVTIASVNGGDVKLVNTALASTLGVRYPSIQETIWDDVTLPSNLLTRAQAWLTSHAAIVKTVKLSAAQMDGLTGLDRSAIRLYDKVHLRSLPRDIDITMLVSKITLDLTASWASEVTIGAYSPTLLDCNVQQTESVEETLGHIEHNYMTVSDAIAIIGHACNINVTGVTTLSQLAALITTSSSRRVIDSMNEDNT